MMRTKEIYYKNRVYKISMDDLKHINGYDVAKLPSEIYVYYDDLDSKWKEKPSSKSRRSINHLVKTSSWDNW